MNAHLRAAQTTLKAAGYDPGPIDGLRGARTGDALCRAIESGRFVLAADVPPLTALGTSGPPGGAAAMYDDRAVDLVKRFEGFAAETYRCPAGVLTIGYGTTKAAGVGIDPQPGMRITEAVAESYLRRTLDKFAAQIRPMITAPITAGEFGAFLSLAYNIGPGAFKGSSALRHFNAGDKAKAAAAMLLWNKANGKKLAGLVRRREAEKALFLS